MIFFCSFIQNLFCLGGSPFGTLGREMQTIPGKAFPYEWSGLHKSTYPSPFFRSHWSKPDEREKAIEKEREKVVLGLGGRREERERYSHWCIFYGIICV